MTEQKFSRKIQKSLPVLPLEKLILQRKPVNQIVSKKFNDSFFQLFSSVKGIGKTTSRRLLARFGLKLSTKLGTMRIVDRVQPILIKSERILGEANLLVGDSLKKEVEANLTEKIKHGTIQGQLFVKGLPVHNQRTKTNASTSKGQRQSRQSYINKTVESKKAIRHKKAKKSRKK